MGANLVTLAEVKAYASINSPNQDGVINQLIPQISELIKSYCGRTFVDYTNTSQNSPKIEVYNGGDSYIYVKEAPLISLEYLEYSTNYGTTYTTLVEGTDYIWDISNQRIQVLGGYTTFPSAINGYKVTYYAGYETLPADLKLAILDTVIYYLKSDMSVKSNATPGRNSVAIEYITNTKLPAHISRVLDLYKQEWN